VYASILEEYAVPNFRVEVKIRLNGHNIKAKLWALNKLQNLTKSHRIGGKFRIKVGGFKLSKRIYTCPITPSEYQVKEVEHVIIQTRLLIAT
jgi:hypothetical protein